MTQVDWSNLKVGNVVQSAIDKSLFRIEFFGPLKQAIVVQMVGGKPVRSTVLKADPKSWNLL